MVWVTVMQPALSELPWKCLVVCNFSVAVHVIKSKLCIFALYLFEFMKFPFSKHWCCLSAFLINFSIFSWSGRYNIRTSQSCCPSINQTAANRKQIVRLVILRGDPDIPPPRQFPKHCPPLDNFPRHFTPDTSPVILPSHFASRPAESHNPWAACFKFLFFKGNSDICQICSNMGVLWQRFFDCSFAVSHVILNRYYLFVEWLFS